MNADDFARNCYAEKNLLLRSYFDGSIETEVGTIIRELHLNAQALASLRKILDCVLTDAFYTLPVGLDGAASIGGTRQYFEICDESGNKITGDGELEDAAFTHFQEA